MFGHILMLKGKTQLMAKTGENFLFYQLTISECMHTFVYLQSDFGRIPTLSKTQVSCKLILKSEQEYFELWLALFILLPLYFLSFFNRGKVF